jgi:acyl-CoA hydrolase
MNVIDNVEIAVDQIIEKLGKKIVMGAPLGAGKPNFLINALYNRVKADPSVKLTICTALTLERPKPKSDLEARFINLFEERVFGDYPDLEYELDRTTNILPQNVEVLEFYFPPGKYLGNAKAQRSYVSSNYTHVSRDMMDRKVNLVLQMVSRQGNELSLSCNADVTTDLIPEMRKQDFPVLAVGQVNQNLPFMYGDANVTGDFFNLVIDQPKQYFKVFGPPKMKVTDADFMIGMNASALVKDDGELQVGIGSLGDAVNYGLVTREKNNDVYNKVLEESGLKQNFGEVLERVGNTDPFDKGLFSATEMMVDGFMELYKAGILKKKVYYHIGLQRLINEGLINPDNLNDNTVELLQKKKIVHDPLTSEDIEFLNHWGILNGEQKGKILKHGKLMHAGFFLGPNNFYEWLKNLPESERRLFAMKSVLKINQLYGHEEIDRLHRKNARFINTCMMTTMSGAHVSDGLADGRLISGVGGQFNFVAMVQELPDGHSVITMRSTRTSKGVVQSNIVLNYGHITVPRHMRDILVTEYGIAFLRGKTDSEIIQELVKVCDSRFQNELVEQGIASGKLESEYKIPKAYQNNYPKKYEEVLSNYKREGFFKPFPFGTDLTDEEIKLGGALKRIKAKMDKGGVSKLGTIGSALMSSPNSEQLKLLGLLKHDKPNGPKEKLFQKIITTEL